PKPGHDRRFLHLALPITNGTAHRIQRGKQTRNERWRVIPEIEIANPVRSETGFGQQSQHGVLRIVDDVPGNVEAVPSCSKDMELPAIDVGDLRNDRAARTQYSADFCEHFPLVRHMFHNVEESDEIEGTIRKSGVL